MSDKKRKITTTHTARAMRDTLLEASSAELQDAIESAGLNPAHLARDGRRAVRRGLRRALESPEIKGAEPEFEEVSLGLGMFIRLLRRREKITEEELAKRARINADEIRKIEFDPQFAPSPRTIYQLEEFFKLPPKTLALLSGAIRARSADTFKDEVVKFAAHSSAIARLSREEKKLLNRFVKFLAEQVD